MSAPMRLLLSTDAVGGVWPYSLELARLLAAEHFEVVLAVLGPAPSPAQRREAARPGISLVETGLPLDWMAPYQDALHETASALVGLAREIRADLVQLHTPALLGRCHWPAPVLAVAHSCTGTWWRAVRADAPPPDDFAWRMAAVREGLSRADVVVAPSAAFARLLGEVYGTRRPIAIVHNTRVWQPAQAPARCGILAAGRLWDEGKNMATLDAAAALLEVPVAAAGALTGPNGAHISLRAIQHLGSLDAGEMVKALTRHRVFAAPALYEPFGLAVLEAAQAGLALVLADIPTFRELWGGAALFVPPRDVQGWASTLQKLHADAACCREWGARAQRHATRYDAVKFIQAMRAQYRMALASRNNMAAA